jgi:hypothetical protein
MAVKMLNDGIELPMEDGLINDLAAYLVTGGDKAAFAKYVSKNYDSSGDYWRIIKDKDGKVVKVLYDGEYTRATVVEADESETSGDITVGSSLSAALAEFVGNGMTQEAMNRIMAESGLDFDTEKRIWYATDESGVYVPPVQQPEEASSAAEETVENTQNFWQGLTVMAEDLMNTAKEGVSEIAGELKEGFARLKQGANSLINQIKNRLFSPEEATVIDQLISDNTTSDYATIPGGDSYAFWTSFMTKEIIDKYKHVDGGPYYCNKFVQDLIRDHYGENFYTSIFDNGWDETNVLFEKFKTNPVLEQIDTTKTSMENIQAMADNGSLILVIYKNHLGGSGHIAFVANSRLTLSTIPVIKSIEGKQGTEISRNEYWPILAQAGSYTGITAIVYATNGYNGYDPKEDPKDKIPFRSRLLLEYLHFYRVKEGTK